MKYWYPNTEFAERKVQIVEGAGAIWSVEVAEEYHDIDTKDLKRMNLHQTKRVGLLPYQASGFPFKGNA